MKPATRSNAKPARKPPRKPAPAAKKRRVKVDPEEEATLVMLRAIYRKPRVNKFLVEMMRRNIDLFPKPKP